MRSRGAAALLIPAVLVALLSACGNDATGAEPAGSAGESADPDSRVTLIDPGAEPREPIRLRLEVGNVQRTSMRMKSSTTMTIDGRPVPQSEQPAMVMGMRVVVEDVSPAGNVQSSFTYDSVEVEGSGAAAAQIQRLLEANLLGIKGELETTANGEFVDGDIDFPMDMDPTMRAMMSSIQTQMDSLTSPLPTEPVGLGAQWTVTSQTEVNGISVDNVYRYELLERSSGGVVLRTTTTGTAPVQDADLPGLPPGAKVHLERMDMSGSGRTELDLARLLPVSSRILTTGDIAMTVDAEGASSRVLQKLSVLVQVGKR